MKEVLIISLFVISIISCKDPQVNVDKTPDYNKLIEKQLNSGLINDTSFLGFVFGWTENQTQKHIDSLILNNRIESRNDFNVKIYSEPMTVNGYKYQMQFDTLNKTDLVIIPIFKDDYLKSLTFVPIYKSETIMQSISFFSDMADFLEKKYGKPNLIINKNLGLYEQGILYWFDGIKEFNLTSITIKEPKPNLLGILVISDIRVKIQEIKEGKFKDSILLKKNIEDLKKAAQDFN
ncbi:MAG: hypothetical protein WAS55_08455 [Saprospiraceae bacterium]